MRPETREQIESLGGKFLDLGVSAAGEGGYARELTAEERAEQQRRLAAALTALKGREVRLNVAIDPAVLGGVHVTVGEEVIDGTVAARLEQARRTMLG